MMMSIFLGDAGTSGTVAGSTTANTGLASCSFPRSTWSWAMD